MLFGKHVRICLEFSIGRKDQRTFPLFLKYSDVFSVYLNVIFDESDSKKTPRKFSKKLSIELSDKIPLAFNLKNKRNEQNSSEQNMPTSIYQNHKMFFFLDNFIL